MTPIASCSSSSKLRLEPYDLVSSKLFVLHAILLHHLLCGLLLILNAISTLLCPCFVFSPSHLVQMDFIWSVCNSKRTEMSPHICQWRVLAYAHCSVSLDRTIYNCQSHVWRNDLALGDLYQRGLSITSINLDRCVEYSQARSVYFNSRFGLNRSPLVRAATTYIASGMFLPPTPAGRHAPEAACQMVPCVHR